MEGKILIVEDDSHILRLVEYNLKKAGFECVTAVTGEQALEVLDKEPVKLIILDIMLPGISGLDVCKEVKRDKKLSSIPIIMLTAKGEEIDRVLGFELGADDYVVKPFSPRELVLRVKAVLKRGISQGEEQDILSEGELKVDISRHRVMVGEEPVKLTAMEFKLLTVLLRRKDRVQSREGLLNDVWDIASDVTTRTIDTHIKRLRHKLGRAGRLIKTVRGLGYKLSNEE